MSFATTDHHVSETVLYILLMPVYNVNSGRNSYGVLTTRINNVEVSGRVVVKEPLCCSVLSVYSRRAVIMPASDLCRRCCCCCCYRSRDTQCTVRTRGAPHRCVFIIRVTLSSAHWTYRLGPTRCRGRALLG